MPISATATAPLNCALPNSLRSRRGGRDSPLVQQERDEQSRTHHARDDHGGRGAVARHRLDRVDQREDAGHREHDAEDVEGIGGRSPVLRDQARAEDEEQDEHRNVDEEDHAPPEVVQQNTADDRAHRASAGERRGPNADRATALAGVREHVGDERQARRQQGRAADAHQGARRDQDAGRGSEGRDDRGDAEEAGAGEQDATTPHAVADVAHRDEQSGDEEPIDVENPQLLGRGRRERVGDRRNGEVQHRDVHRDQEHREGEHGQSQPRSSVGGTRGRVEPVRRVELGGHHFLLRGRRQLPTRTVYAGQRTGMSTLYAIALFPL